MLRDRDVRRLLHERLRAEHPSGDGTLIVDELGLCNGTARIDVAVINSRLDGYEIKSPADTLSRLDAQVEVYSKVFDRLYLVLGSNHLDRAAERVPDWCGLIEVAEGDLVEVREASQNPSVDCYSLARLLWRDEALALLEELGESRGLRGKPRKAVWHALSDSLPLASLADTVRETLKARPEWRAATTRT
ncbi:MAG: sce7726 family protein [Coriobacteriia bacterium]